MAKVIIRNTHQETVVKVYGAAGVTETITLATDLLHSAQALDGATQTATITGVNWTGDTNGVITISRNSARIMTLQANAAGMLFFEGQAMPPDNVNPTHNIVVAITGAASECWIKIRKVSGYASKIETATFGAYDNETLVGS